MKYFTREWCFGCLNDSKIKKIQKEYILYIDSIYEKLPFPLKLLSRCINLHDGIIKKVFYCKLDKNLTLSGVFGDLQTTYFELTFVYFNAPLNDAVLAELFQSGIAEILSDEIEMIACNHFAHRIMFSNKKEAEIHFERLELKVISISPTDYQRRPCTLEIRDGTTKGR